MGGRVVEIAEGLWRVRLFTAAQCRELLEQIDAQRARAGGAPNTMNRYGVTLGGSLRPLFAELNERYVQPLSSRRLRKHPHAFAVDYTPRTQRALAAHVDDSEMTLNVCLGPKFTGGDLVCIPDDEKSFRVAQKPGYALIHRGQLAHRALSITSGARTNLVLWCRARA